MKELTIELKGPKGSGKTTVARLIKHVLGLYNVNIVEVNDKDIYKPGHDYSLNNCMESLSERVQVKIKTRSTNELFI